MLQSKLSFLPTALLLTASMLLTACGGNIIKPIRQDIIGNSTVRNINVVALDSASSSTIAGRVKTAVRSEASSELRGNMQVDLKISLDKWNGKEKVLGGSVTNTLLGSTTDLNGTVEILDTKTRQLIGKYSIYSKYEEGGLLGTTTTISITDTDKTVIDNFATFTIDMLQ